MNYEKEDQVISLRTMAFAVLRQWKKMILAAVALAVVLGGIRGLLRWREVSNPDYIAQQTERYETALEDYEVELEGYERKLEALREDISLQQEYLMNSVLMQLDYRDVYVATAGLYIHAGDANAEVAAAIADAYRIVLMDRQRLETIARELEMEHQYLRELITLTDEDETTPLLTVTVRHSGAESAQKILDLLLRDLKALEAQLQNSTSRHTVGVISGGVSAEVDLDLADLQEDEDERLEDYKDALDSYQDDTARPQLPQMPELGAGTVVKNAAVFAVVGAFLGVVLVVVWACAAYILDDKVYSGEEIQGRLGIRLLGKIAPVERKKCALDQWLDAKEHRARYADDAAAAMAAANVRNYGVQLQPILVSGSADQASVDAFVENLRKELPDLQIQWCGSLLDSVPALEQLSGCGSVLLVERCGVSHYTAVAKQIETVKEMNKKLIGVVALEA